MVPLGVPDTEPSRSVWAIVLSGDKHQQFLAWICGHADVRVRLGDRGRDSCQERAGRCRNGRAGAADKVDNVRHRLRSDSAAAYEGLGFYGVPVQRYWMADPDNRCNYTVRHGVIPVLLQGDISDRGF